MAQTSVRTQVWDFNKLSTVFGGVPIIDYAPDTGIETTDNSDKYSQTVSLTRGNVVYNQLNDGTGYVKLSILANSPTHFGLYELYKDRLDGANEGIAFEGVVVNTNNNTLSESYQGCMIKTMPSPTKAREVANVDIEIWYAERIDYRDGAQVNG